MRCHLEPVPQIFVSQSQYRSINGEHDSFESTLFRFSNDIRCYLFAVVTGNVQLRSLNESPVASATSSILVDEYRLMVNTEPMDATAEN